MIKIGSTVKLIDPKLGYEVFQNHIGIIEYGKPSSCERDLGMYHVRFVDPVYSKHVLIALFGRRLEEVL